MGYGRKPDGLRQENRMGYGRKTGWTTAGTELGTSATRPGYNRHWTCTTPAHTFLNYQALTNPPARAQDGPPQYRMPLRHTSGAPGSACPYTHVQVPIHPCTNYGQL